MVQFPRYRFCPLCIHEQMNAIQDVRVTPFGHPRIQGCLLLPVAFRSLPRPSSPDSSKASPANSSSLDHITPTSSVRRSIKQLGISTSRKHARSAHHRTSSTFSVPFSVVPVTPVTSPKLSKTRPRPRGAQTAPPTRGFVEAHGGRPPRPLSYVLEVWGFEPQTYGLQSHRSSHLSYTPVRSSPRGHPGSSATPRRQDKRRESPHCERVVRVTLGRRASFAHEAARAIVQTPLRALRVSLKGGDPAAPSGTATLLRLHPPYRAYLRRRPPQGLGERLRVPPTQVV